MIRAGKIAAVPANLCKNSLLPVLLIFSSLVGAADITVHADRNPAVLQESLQLVFEATGGVDDDPDFSPLEDDFEILSTSASTSMRIANTRITRTREWRLTLLPQKTGDLVIPAISFGKDKSPQTALTVIAAGSGRSGQASSDIFVEVEAIPASAYVQAEVIYRIKLYRASATSNETLSEPEVSQGSAIIEVLDADRSYETVVEGKRYGVFERSYGLYPQVSGTLLIQPVRFQGQLSGTSPYSLDPFGSGARTVVKQSEAIELQVDPVPAAYPGGHWLPAKDMKITEKWSKNPLELLPNEPVTRTLTITALGLTASQLPELPELLPEGFRQYPDQPELENRKTEQGITGVRQQKNAIIPARAGEYTLPELSLPWWNTETQSVEYAVLPERRAQVTAAAPEASIGAPDIPVPAQDVVETTPDAVETTPVAGAGSTSATLWQWLAGIFALAWVITIVYGLKWPRKSRFEEQPDWLRSGRGDSYVAPTGACGTYVTHLAEKAVKDLELACRDNDPQQAKSALLPTGIPPAWSRTMWHASQEAKLASLLFDLGWSRVKSLGDLEKNCSGELAAEIRNLSHCLYARTPRPWHGEALWRALLQELQQRESRAAQTNPERGELEPLFRL